MIDFRSEVQVFEDAGRWTWRVLVYEPDPNADCPAVISREVCRCPLSFSNPIGCRHDIRESIQSTLAVVGRRLTRWEPIEGDDRDLVETLQALLAWRLHPEEKQDGDETD